MFNGNLNNSFSNRKLVSIPQNLPFQVYHTAPQPNVLPQNIVKPIVNTEPVLTVENKVNLEEITKLIESKCSNLEEQLLLMKKTNDDFHKDITEKVETKKRPKKTNKPKKEKKVTENKY